MSLVATPIPTSTPHQTRVLAGPCRFHRDHIVQPSEPDSLELSSRSCTAVSVSPGSASGKDTISGLACSIVYSGAVHLESKRFSRKEWFFRSMECSKGQYDTMMAFCQEHKGEGFNHLGYFLYWSPIRPSPTAYNWLGMSSRWYCSEIVIGALKHGEILDDSVSNSMHPHALYQLVQPSSMADCGRNMKQVNLRFV